MNDKFTLQNSQYFFPYHHIPYLNENDVAICLRHLKWGFEYLSYIKKILDLSKKIDAKKIIEIGCGDGKIIGSIGLEKDNTYGIDLSDTAIAFAKAFYPKTKFECRNINSINQQYDLVLLIEVLEHIKDNELSDFSNLVNKCIKENGSLILSVPTNVRKVHKKHYRHYDIDSLLKDIHAKENGLEVEEVYYLCQDSGLYTFYNRFMNNKHWILHIDLLNKLAWNYYNKKLLTATEYNGTHLIVRFLKK